MPYHFPGIPPFIEAAAKTAGLGQYPNRAGGQTLVRAVASRLCQITDMPQLAREEAIAGARADLTELRVSLAACEAAIDEVERELVRPAIATPRKPRRTDES